MRARGTGAGISPTCLFVINGLGLGNSTRCHAVMEYLAEAGCALHVLSSGNGLTYFQDQPGVTSVTAMDSFFYPGRREAVNGWSLLGSLGVLAQVARRKRAALARLLDAVRPDVGVIDSEYAIGPLRRRGVPVIGLNTSEVVVTEYLRRARRQPGIGSQFWFVEYADYLFHRYACDLVVSPFPLRTPTRHPRFRRVGLIVRRAVREEALRAVHGAFPTPGQLRTVVFMLSGSVHASRIAFDGREFPFAIEVVGRSGDSRDGVTFHGRRLDNAGVLARADALVINGGYSALSEAFALRKPTFVVPVPGHAEQFVNACLAEDLGLGFRVTADTVLDRLEAMWRANRWIGLHEAPAAFEFDGAREAADLILQCATAKRSRSGAVGDACLPHPDNVVGSAQTADGSLDNAA